MILYAESSAVLSWLLAEPTAREAAELLGGAEGVVTSDLTLIECDRVLVRAAAAGTMSRFELVRRRTLLVAASAHWHRIPLAGS
jgi:hypothetical protein